MNIRLHNIFKALAALMLLAAPFTAKADFVDDINNNASGYAAGQRVIYELNVGSFTSAGTFRAAQAQLQTLKTLGVDIVWVMPVYPRDNGQNSPYAAVDFKAVNSKYGTVADFKNFVDAAHRLGMKVWLDWVPNHTSTKNAWVTQHPEYYTKVNGRNVHPASDGNYYQDGQSASNGAIIYQDVYQLNYSNTALQNAMNDCLKFWIDQTGIDGYRCDMVSSKGIPASYWQTAIPLIKSYANKEFFFLGEDDMSNASEYNKRSVGFDYDYAWNFQESNLQNGFGSGSNANTLRNYCTSFTNTSRNLGVGRLVYLTNHDQNFNGSKQTLTQKYGANKYLLTVLEFTLYGMPLIYNGEEVGGDQALNYFQDTKINWSASDNKMKNTLRTLAALKHSEAALKDGKTASDNGSVTFLTTNQQANVLAYKRTSGKNEVLVVLNPSASQQTVTIQNVNGSYSKWLDGATIANGASRSNVTFNGSATITIPSKGYQVYVNENASEEKPSDDGVPVITNLTDDTPMSIFYESDLKDASVHAWFYGGPNGGEKYTANGGGWPGDAFTMIGKTTDGRYIYKLSFTLKDGITAPTNVIITENGSDDANKVCGDSRFVNHGYYVKDIKTGSTKTVPYVPTGIKTVSVNTKSLSDNRYYDLAGREISKPERGFFIHNGKKYIVR